MKDIDILTYTKLIDEHYKNGKYDLKEIIRDIYTLGWIEAKEDNEQEF